jgi:hypothetical protein
MRQRWRPLRVSMATTAVPAPNAMTTLGHAERERGRLRASRPRGLPVAGSRPARRASARRGRSVGRREPAGARWAEGSDQDGRRSPGRGRAPCRPRPTTTRLPIATGGITAAEVARHASCPSSADGDGAGRGARHHERARRHGAVRAWSATTTPRRRAGPWPSGRPPGCRPPRKATRAGLPGLVSDVTQVGGEGDVAGEVTGRSRPAGAGRRRRPGGARVVHRPADARLSSYSRRRTGSANTRYAVPTRRNSAGHPPSGWVALARRRTRRGSRRWWRRPSPRASRSAWVPHRPARCLFLVHGPGRDRLRTRVDLASGAPPPPPTVGGVRHEGRPTRARPGVPGRRP